jgi:DNA-binding FadR family transcriptional regulator
MIESDDMPDAFAPVRREKLYDRVADRIGGSIARGQFRPGERLPAIGEMARAFGVAPGSVRAALTKLETLRVVEVRQGLGVFVIASVDSR